MGDGVTGVTGVMEAGTEVTEMGTEMECPLTASRPGQGQSPCVYLISVGQFKNYVYI
jgi:hypothetical protein